MELKEALNSLNYSESAAPLSPSHIAWVPCVSGHLDFGLMRVGLEGSQDKNGARDDPNYTINYNSSGPRGSHQRNIVLESWVDWRDSDLGDGCFRVILIAEANESRDLDSRSLRGQIFIYPKSYEDSELSAITSDLLTKIRELHKLLLETDENPDDWPTQQNKLNQKFNALRDKINCSAPFGFPDILDNDTPIQHQYVIDFWVAHNGLSFLKLKDKNHNKAFPVSEYAQYTATRQAFYYIKYGLHTHKHHDCERDALTTVVPVKTCALDPIWLQLSGQLKRELVRIKRTQSIAENTLHADDVHSAEGILAYSRTLLSQLNHHKFISVDLYSRELESLNGIHDSLSAHVSKAAQENKEKERKEDLERHWGTFFIAIFGAVGVSIANFANIAFKGKTDDHPVVIFIMLFCTLLIIGTGTKLTISAFKQKANNPIYIERLIKEKGFFNKESAMKGFKTTFLLIAFYTILKGLVDIAFTYGLVDILITHLQTPLP